MVDDDRFPIAYDGQITMRSIRFRTLGCYPLTVAIESKASTINDIIRETFSSNVSERNGRLIDRDDGESLELKKQNGYF